MTVVMIVTVVMVMMVVVTWAQNMLVFVAVYRREARRVAVLVGMAMTVVMLMNVMVFVPVIVHAELGRVDAVFEDFFGGDRVAFDIE